MRNPILYRIALLSMLLLAAADVQAQADRSAPPAPGPVPALQLPPVRHFTLSNGLAVVLVEKPQVPVVQVTLVVDAGVVDEPAGKHGLADLALDLMDEGAGARDALALADAVDFVGAALTTEAGLHTSTVELFTPVARLVTALALMAVVVLRPVFAEAELERLRLQRLTGLVQARDDPQAIAATLFDRVLYGPAHPYGYPPGEAVEAALRSITAADLRRFHETHFRPGDAALVVAGAVTQEGIAPKLETVFGGWTAGDAPTAEVAAPAQVEGRVVYLVDKPGAAQSVIRVGRIGAARSTADYHALVVLNTVLGDAFTSRLNQNLREDKGYTYGARSSFAFRPVAGPFQAGASVQTDVTAPALAEFMKELHGIRAPVPDDELARARNYVALQYPRAFQTVGQVAGQLVDLVRYDLPDDYFERYQERILAVTAADVQAAARRYVDPGNVAVVVVGDRAAIEADVRALGLGEVRVLSVEDVLGPVPEL